MSTQQAQRTQQQQPATRQQPSGATGDWKEFKNDFERLLEREVTSFSAFGSMNDFENAQRMALMLSRSTIVPENFRGAEHLGDCVIAIEIANRIGASVLAVMQNIYIVYGKPAWSAQFLISCANASRKFTSLRFEMSEPVEKVVDYEYTAYVGREKTKKTGQVTVKNQTCRAWAVDRQGERLQSPEVSVELAVKEGWFLKDGSKWKTMPELMLMYRAATLFCRLYAPELTMGIKSVEEAEDIGPELPVAGKLLAGSAGSNGATNEVPEFTAGAAVKSPGGVPSSPSSDTEKPSASASSTGLLTLQQRMEQSGVPVKESVKEPEPKKEPKKEPEPPKKTRVQQGELLSGSANERLGKLMALDGVSFDKFRAWAGDTERLANADSYGTWEELPAGWCEQLLRNEVDLNKCIVRCKP